MEFIEGKYVSCVQPGSYTLFPCGNDNWFNQVWSEKRLQTPVVTPDGGAIYGSYTRYNYARGHHVPLR